MQDPLHRLLRCFRAFTPPPIHKWHRPVCTREYTVVASRVARGKSRTVQVALLCTPRTASRYVCHPAARCPTNECRTPAQKAHPPSCNLDGSPQSAAAYKYRIVIPWLQRARVRARRPSTIFAAS